MYKEMKIFTLVLVTITFFVLVTNCSANYSGSECIDSKIAKSIYVSQSKGKGQFSRIQDAIDSIPSNNKQWIRLVIDPGTYEEVVTIPYDKECVILQGHSPLDTIISSSVYNSSEATSTFTSSATNFMAKNITFKNTYGSFRKWKQAEAARIYGDKSAFYNCRFEGIQDTLWDALGRHYFKSCFIEGAVDFIWGTCQSVYEDCDIKVLFGAFITAQGRQASNDTNGFVFIGGRVRGKGLSYLGRAYAPYSKVVFLQTFFEPIIQPLGWNAWRAIHEEQQVTYIEENCTGRGADLTHRVPWMKRSVSKSELSQYTVSAFIDQDGWISKQPYVSSFTYFS